VEAALASLPEVSDSHQAGQALGSEPEPSSLFRVLKRLVREGVLTVERRGFSRKPARSRKAAAAA
jgi:DNA-binding PadR family transcriptional regulator